MIGLSVEWDVKPQLKSAVSQQSAVAKCKSKTGSARPVLSSDDGSSCLSPSLNTVLVDPV